MKNYSGLTHINLSEFLDLAFDQYKLAFYPESLDDIPADIVAELKEKYIINKRVETLYLEYTNDFLTVERFAEYHGFNLEKAHRLLQIGRKLNDRKSKENENRNK